MGAMGCSAIVEVTESTVVLLNDARQVVRFCARTIVSVVAGT